MSTLYSKIDSRHIPIYSIQDTARYLRIPASTIRSWTIGHRYTVKSGSNFFAPLIEISQAKPYLLSFTNLVEIHVLRAIRQHHKIQLHKVRTALDFIDAELKVAHPRYPRNEKIHLRKPSTLHCQSLPRWQSQSLER